jgi:hypothetical protein
MELAEKIGFVKRNDGKLLPITLVKALTIGILNESKVTLQVIACKCEEMQENLRISKEAIYQRLKTGSKLMKEIFEETIRDALQKVSKTEIVIVFKQFKNVYICDSTILQVPDKLKDIFPAAGSTNLKSALKLQVVFSIINRNIKKLEIFKGTDNDQQYAYEIAKMLEPNELVIFDLGYYGKPVLNEIKAKGAYFVSRISHHNKFYIKAQTPGHNVKNINILEAFKKSDGIVDIEIMIGREKAKRLTCRLVAAKLPEEVANERRRKAKIKAKGKTLSDYQLEFLGWNIFITNCSEDMLSLEAICDIYRIRWQIEILFKSYKSHMNLEGLGLGGKNQVESILYGRLIMITLFTTVYSNMYKLMFELKKRELSILKFLKILNTKLFVLKDCMSDRKINLVKLSELFIYSAEKSLYDKRNRKTTVQTLIEYQKPNFLPKAG